MKKCDNCGAVQSDDRTVCIDCGNYLDRSLTNAEAEKAEAEIDAAVSHGLDPTDNFTVQRRDKIFGWIALGGVVLCVVLLVIVGALEGKYQPDYPDVHPIHESIYGITYLDPEKGPVMVSNPYADEARALERAAGAALAGMVAFAISAVAFFFPQLMWYLDTARARRYVVGELLPTRGWVITNRITQYGTFAVGWMFVLVSIVSFPW